MLKLIDKKILTILLSNIVFTYTYEFSQLLLGANYSLDSPMDACWLENAKCYIFGIPPQKIKFIFPYFKHEMCLRYTFSSFQCLFETHL